MNPSGEKKKMTTKQKVFLAGDRMAAIECPKCRKTKLSDVSNFLQLSRKVKIKVNCPCGHKFPVILERRRHIRKLSNFPGIYYHVVPGQGRVKKAMTVKDISLSGIKVKLNAPPLFKGGDRLIVEFRLDDSQRSLIRKEVRIRKIENLAVGAEFCADQETSRGDRELGFYFLT